MKDILFWGATGQARVLHEALDPAEWRLVALVDRRCVPSPWPHIAVLVGEQALDDWLRQRSSTRPLHAVAAIGGTGESGRLQVMDLLVARGLVLPSVIHRNAFVARDSVLGEGCQILAQSAVCSHARLGRGVIVNTAASVDHDGVIGDGVHLAPGARLAGEVTVDTGAFIGTGAVVLPRLRIGAHAVVGAGAVVTRDVAPGCTVVGNPARPLPSRSTP